MSTAPSPDELVESGRKIARVVAARTFADYKRRGFTVEFDDAHAGALLGLVHAARSYDPSREASYTTWAFPYARRYAEMAIRADAGLTSSRGDGRHVSSLDDTLEDERPDEPVDDAADGDLQAERMGVRDAVRRLPDLEREVVFLTYWSDLGPTAVGARVGMSKSGARKALERGHVQLRDALLGPAA